MHKLSVILILVATSVSSADSKCPTMENIDEVMEHNPIKHTPGLEPDSIRPNTVCVDQTCQRRELQYTPLTGWTNVPDPHKSDICAQTCGFGSICPDNSYDDDIAWTLAAENYCGVQLGLPITTEVYDYCLASTIVSESTTHCQGGNGGGGGNGGNGGEP